MTDFDEGQQLSAQYMLANDLLDTNGLMPVALDHLRRWLRLEDTITTSVAISPNLALCRGFLLDRVCRALAATGSPDQEQATLDYYRGAGDLLDEAPADIADIGITDIGDITG
jgi:hypothetical protein